jgi:hypothetical protein
MLQTNIRGLPGAVRPWLTGWVALGLALTAVAVVLALSALAAERFGLIFHFHPAAIVVGGAWLYRRLEGERPCTTRSWAFLVGALGLVASYQQSLEPRGVADPWPLTFVIALAGALFGARILFRSAHQAACDVGHDSEATRAARKRVRRHDPEHPLLHHAKPGRRSIVRDCLRADPLLT